MDIKNCSARTIPSRGFTLIEILVVMGMLALLSTIVLVAVNPLRQFAQARNTQRQANVSAILNAVGNRLADNRGIFTGDLCTKEIPPTATVMGKADATQYDIRPCLVPAYLSDIPVDPTDGASTCTTPVCNSDNQSYVTQYTIQQDAATQRITVCAPKSVEPALSNPPMFCLTR